METPPPPPPPESSDGGTPLPFPDQTPALNGVTTTSNLDSVVVEIPQVDGAQDYRVFTLPATVSFDAQGAEQVDGSTIFCGGLEQHNAPVTPAVPVRRIELLGITAPTLIVVEALDRLCPFAGVLGKTHADVAMNNAEVPASDRVPFSFFTEAEIRAAYGSLIVNGHGPAAQIGTPAPPSPPKVLARTQLSVQPLPASAKPAMTFFEDFSAADQPQLVGPITTMSRAPTGQLQQNSRFDFYAYGFDKYQLFVDRGALHMVLADFAQDVFSSLHAIPRQAVQLPDSSHYLHVTWEVHTVSSGRRYWYVLLCGAATAGATFNADGTVNGHIIPMPFFMEPDGLDPSVEGWNCLHVFPRDGYPYALAGGTQPPQTDIRVMVNTPNAGGNDRTNVVNLSPTMYSSSLGPPSWYRQLDVSHTPTAPMLDELQQVSPRVKWDLYIRRDRVVLFANGKQRLCNDFPSNALTMAEAALDFSQVLYHSTAERLEFSVPYWVKTGQRYYLTDTPYVDERVWDNLGYDENVAEPAGFDASLCYNHG